MNLILATLVVMGFATTINFLNLSAHTRETGKRSIHCLRVLRDDSLSDRNKEEALQREALMLFRHLGILVGGSVLALGIPLAFVWLLGQMGIGSLNGTLAVLERIDFLVAISIGGLLFYFFIRHRRRS